LRIKQWIERKYPHLTVMLQAEHCDDMQWFKVPPIFTQFFPALRYNIEFWQGGRWMSEPINTHGARRKPFFQSLFHTVGPTLGMVADAR
jgi:hypothetical protein